MLNNIKSLAQVKINTDSLAGPTTTKFNTFEGLVNFIINTVFVVGLAVALLFVIIGGIKYITSGGDEGKATEARNTITNAVIGAVVIIAFRIILDLVVKIIFGQSLGDVIDKATGQTP